MKSFKQFISESVNISGNASVGTIVVNSTPQTSSQVEESFIADVIWQGNLYRMRVEGAMIPPNKLAEQLQSEYPGAIVHNIYPVTEKNINVIDSKRYHPSKLEWI